ncbi:hypothetical protein SAMN04489806_1974 [Paramicrobacterium humi]|uniref:Uncharacterized protein n=1 Tax=Paramicrobacterium humi TaxID=640635 RepID=A0A1H4MT51_9MICO|nr:hypothetical protein [Microbacterium humi]SEB86206.1 hypothetical protein SAMN04489806_1974 [Microbacterium humi]
MSDRLTNRGTPLIVGRSTLPFLWTGGAAIILGGVVAAVTAPLRLEHGSWASAYLVLVVGVALIALGAVQSRLAQRLSGRAIGVELGGWLVGSAGVIGGTLLEAPPIVDVGGILLLVSLITFMLAVRRPAPAPPVMLWTFRLVVAIIIVSIPIGLVLSQLRHG